MDHQQNFEYGDPNSLGFINTFAGSENYMVPQGQQQQLLNGKPHTPLMSMEPLQNFSSVQTEPSQFIAQTPAMMFQLPSDIVQESAALYPPVGYQSLSNDSTVSTQKDSMFNMDNPPSAVPADIIEQSKPVIEKPKLASPCTEASTSDQPSLPLSNNILSKINSSSSIELIQLTTSENLLDAETGETASSIHALQSKSTDQSHIVDAISVVEKKPTALAQGVKKRRRRILQLNDDSDDENELKKELLQSSPEKEKAVNNERTDESSPDSESDDPSETNPDVLMARFLLKSAVIILGPDGKKKKKKRVLESDDEDEMQTSVDDIGLIEFNEHENDIHEEDILCGGIVIAEPVFEPIEESITEIPFETPPKDDFALPASEKLNEILSESEVDEIKADEPVIKISTRNDDNKTEEDLEIVDKDDLKSIIKTEIDPSMSVEAILDNIKPMADDDEFFKVGVKSEDSDVEILPNEEYFGTPDVSKPRPRSRKRAPRPGVRRESNQNPSKRTRSNKYEKDFVDGSSESDDTSFSEPSSESSDSSVEEVGPNRRLPPPKRSPVIAQTKTFTVTKVPIRRKVVSKDRFYDKSRDIPNDVYFGDVKVPLHVLHTRWDAEAVSPESSDDEKYPQNKSANSRFCAPSSSRSSTSFSYIEQNDDPKLSTLKDFAKMCGIKINYARLFESLRSTEDKCVQIRRIMAQKGLQGEPTVAKCKQLRLDIQAKRESAELDKSVIIRAEGRTRRATRNVTTSNSPFLSKPTSASRITVQPETLQTLSKIRRVVDSDSE